MAANDPRRLSTSAAPGVAGTVVIRVPEARHLLSLSAGATPVARVRPGDTVVLETADCFAGQIHEPDQAPASVDWDRINPATGPVYVEGAAPGDVLVVRIDRIEVTSPGVMAVSPGFGVLRDRIEETRFEV